MKAVSEILAVLLMIVIVIGLVGVLWYFMRGASRMGNFIIQDASCSGGSLRIVASYSGNDATPGDVILRVRNKFSGAVSTPAITIYKGPACAITNIGAAGCNTPASAAAPITSAETVGITASYSVTSGTQIDIELIVFGHRSAPYTVTCY
jgi:flagellin-like protein